MSRIATAVLGLTSLLALGVLAVLGLVVAPPDAFQGDAQRLMYVHVPAAWVAYMAFLVTSVCSGFHLASARGSLRYDRVAGASAEVGVVFIALTLALGSLWGRPVWGVWWVWDARLVTTAVLLFLYLGYLALRRVPATPQVRARRCAVAALAAFVDVPIVHFSVTWWRTLHQEGTVFNAAHDPKIGGVMALTLLVGVVAFVLVYLYLLERRYRVAVLEDRLEGLATLAALAERRESGASDGEALDAELGSGARR